MMKKIRFNFYGMVGLFLITTWIVVSCATSPSAVNNFEDAYQYLQENLLPSIQVDAALVADTSAQSRVIPPLVESLPKVETFPLFGAKPTHDPGTLYVEIFSSAEKGNGDRPDERWLVDVAEAFNKQQQQISGQVIQVGIRNIPSGIAAKLLAAKTTQPTGYSPSNDLWLELLKREGIAPMMVEPKLIPDCGGLLIEEKTYQQLAKGGNVTFARLLDQILAGQLKLGYANPYTSSSSLNLLYQLLWQAAGHDKDGKPLTVNEIDSPQVVSVFDTFQKQVAVTGLTTIDLKDAFLRDSSKLQVFASGCSAYIQMQHTPGHEQVGFVPYGISHNNPLVGFEWNTKAQQEALIQFAKFAVSTPMQQRIPNQSDFSQSLNGHKFLPTPSGDVLKAAQSLWKQRKDGGKAVYMELVIDTSGSMEENQRLKAVQEALRVASQQINSGNQIGLITFSDRPTRRINFAPFNELEKKRLLTAIDELKPDGATALYDAVAVGLGDLMNQKKRDPDGRFYLLLLTDGERTDGIDLASIRDVIKQSGVRVYPIAYGEVNQAELKEIAAIREGSVYSGSPETVQTLLRDLFQTNL
jgi:Ca-activated chloride channel homolog